jgi:hypothetical protein
VFHRSLTTGVVALAVVLLACGGYAVAQQTTTSAPIRACVSKKTGALRILRRASRHCRSGETSISWNRQGAAGTSGTSGAAGSQGQRGDTGPRGAAGPQGERGPQGEMGPKGDTGERGPRGDAGDKGPKGDTGDKGAKGDTGETGPKGDTGPPGSDAQFTGAAAGGDLAGTFPNPDVAPDAIGGAEIADGSISNSDLAPGVGQTFRKYGTLLNATSDTVSLPGWGQLKVNCLQSAVTVGASPLSLVDLVWDKVEVGPTGTGSLSTTPGKSSLTGLARLTKFGPDMATLQFAQKSDRLLTAVVTTQSIGDGAACTFAVHGWYSR